MGCCRVVGMGALVLAGQVLGDSNPGVVIALAYVSFAMTDVSHDVLLGFGRALVGDIVPPDQVGYTLFAWLVSV